MRSLLRLSLASFAVTFALAACGGSGTNTTGTGGHTSATGGHATGGSGQGAGGGGLQLDGGNGSDAATDGGSCEPPDVLIALDRTLTMHKTPNGAEPTDAPDYQSSKWWQAITALHGLVAPPADNGIRFGLELWPKEEPGCVTLAQRVMGMTATNPQCEDGEVLVSPDLGTGTTINGLLDPSTTKICISTPTGAGLLTGEAHLKGIKKQGRDQYLLLVTDGADWDQSCPTPDPVAVTQQIAAGGIKTFVVGFSATGDIMPGGVGAPFLNNMACAGMTAKDFANNCTMGATGYVAKDPMGPTLYLQASDGAALTTALGGIAVSICCDCVH
jgi:hypothetical protein